MRREGKKSGVLREDQGKKKESTAGRNCLHGRLAVKEVKPVKLKDKTVWGKERGEGVLKKTTRNTPPGVDKGSHVRTELEREKTQQKDYEGKKERHCSTRELTPKTKRVEGM